MRELWLLRHAHATHKGHLVDIDRCLDGTGEHEAKRIGKWLKHKGLYPDAMISSPATRAMATAQIIADSLALANDCRWQDPRLYCHGVDAIKSMLAEVPATVGRLLIVGHNPDFEQLLLSLADNDQLPTRDGLLPTAALARLEMPDDWLHLPTACATVLKIKLAQ